VVGIIILSEIIYWYRPVTGIDEPTGRKASKRAKFSGDKFKSPIGYYQHKFGFTKDQVRQALKRLEQGGFIKREYRDYISMDTGKPMVTNITHVEPVPERILEITHQEPAKEPEPFEPESIESNPAAYYKDGASTDNAQSWIESMASSEPDAEQAEGGEVSVPQGEVYVPPPLSQKPHPPLTETSLQRLLLRFLLKLLLQRPHRAPKTSPPKKVVVVVVTVI
jgi:hypothetical protein